MYTGFIGWIDSMVEAITSKVNAVMNFVKNKVDSAKQALASIGGKVSDAVSNTVSNVSNAVSGARANGGNVQAGKSYLVGEQGRELFVPQTSGTIVPNASLGGGITINMGGVSVSNEADENRLVEKIKKAFIQEAKLYNL